MFRIFPFPSSTPSQWFLSKETSPNPSNGPEDLCLKPQGKDRASAFQGKTHYCFICFGYLWNVEAKFAETWQIGRWARPTASLSLHLSVWFCCGDIIELGCPSKNQLTPTASFVFLFSMHSLNSSRVCLFHLFTQITPSWLSWKNPSNPGKKTVQNQKKSQI